jgi:hypothetical protein
MSLTRPVLITVPLAGGPNEVRVDLIGTLGPTGNKPAHVYIRPGEEREFHIHSGMNLRISEVPPGTADSGKLPRRD